MGLFSSRKTSITETDVTNNYNDQRQVQDAGGGVIGSGNVFDSSTNTRLSTSNSGNTTTNTSLSTALRNSNNTRTSLSTSNSGNTTTNTSTTNNVLDGGAIGAAFRGIDNLASSAFGFGTDALGFAGNVAGRALDLGGKVSSGSLDALKGALDGAFKSNANTLRDALDFAGEAQAKSFAKFGDTIADALKFSGSQTSAALGSAAQTTGALAGAYADAKGRGQLTDYLILAALGVAGLIAWRAVRK